MLTTAFIANTLHIGLPRAGYRGGTLYVPAAGFTPTPTGLRVRAMGQRPAPRAYRPSVPQVQACRVPRRSAPCNPAAGVCQWAGPGHANCGCGS